MENYNELIELLKTYLYMNMDTPPMSVMDICITYCLPILSSILLVGTAIAGVIKYYDTKNKEIYEMILNDVYAPLYQYFVKQELYSNIHMPNRNYRETPIMEVINVKTTEKFNNEGMSSEIEKSFFLNLTREEFIRVKNNINIGLASQELLTLLNMYEVLISIESTYDKSGNEYLEATILKVDVENAIRCEVFTGYQKYYEKLKLSKITEVEFWELTDDQIVFKYEIDNQRKEVLKENMALSPEKYEES